MDLPGRDPEATYQFADLTTRGAPLQIATHALGALLLPGYQRPPDGQPAGVEIAFFTDDVPAAFERAVAAGATIAAPPKVMPWGQTVAYVRSLEGTCSSVSVPPCGRRNSLPSREDGRTLVPARPGLSEIGSLSAETLLLKGVR